MSEPSPRVVDVRVGSSTDGLTPISVRERALGARLPDWLALAAVVGAAVMADQLTKRIEDGTYGICTNCGRPISEERLEALPWAELCIDCARLR